jgi:hypothetical protein
MQGRLAKLIATKEQARIIEVHRGAAKLKSKLPI